MTSVLVSPSSEFRSAFFRAGTATATATAALSSSSLGPSLHRRFVLRYGLWRQIRFRKRPFRRFRYRFRRFRASNSAAASGSIGSLPPMITAFPQFRYLPFPFRILARSAVISAFRSAHILSLSKSASMRACSVHRQLRQLQRRFGFDFSDCYFFAFFAPVSVSPPSPSLPPKSAAPLSLSK
jgi:hypothetical protein